MNSLEGREAIKCPSLHGKGVGLRQASTQPDFTVKGVSFSLKMYYLIFGRSDKFQIKVPQRNIKRKCNYNLETDIFQQCIIILDEIYTVDYLILNHNIN